MMPHYDGNKFYNPWNTRSITFLDVLKWKLDSRPKPWPKRVDVAVSVPPERSDAFQATWVGHSTVLIQVDGKNILTDPIWSDRASPFSWMGPKRVTKPGIEFEKLPKIDFVLISHSHYDHLDKATIKKLYLRDDPLFIVPLGVDEILKSFEPAISVEALDWGETCENFALEPAQHSSARSFFDVDQTLWGSFVISSSVGHIYFAGDSGYHTHFLDIAKKYGSFAFAMLPIGAFEPRWLMKYPHMNPDEAVQAYLDLGEPLTLAIHHRTFPLTDEAYDDPTKELEKFNLTKFKTLMPGQSLTLE